MKFDSQAYQNYRAFLAQPGSVPTLPPHALARAREFGARIQNWREAHPVWDMLLSMLPVILSVIALALMKSEVAGNHELPVWVRVVLCGIGYGLVGYPLASYGNHDCAAHSASVIARGPLSSWVQRALGNLGRLFYADPAHFRELHLAHHRELATPQDGTFTHWVDNRRILRSLIPGAGVFFENDYQVHAAWKWSRSKAVSTLGGLLTVLGLTWFFASDLGVIPAWLAFGVMGTWMILCLDRLRESVEHQLMPPDRFSGTREIGGSCLGWILGGGPWGQNYHLSHHLIPSLPWYGQMLVSRRLRNSVPEDVRSFYFPPSSLELAQVIRRLLTKTGHISTI
jgi:fatty acid desaturase